MATITERNGRFTIRVRIQGAPTATKTFTRRSDAERWGRKVQAELESGLWVPEKMPVPTLRHAVQEYRRTVGAKLRGAPYYERHWDAYEALPWAAKAIDKVTPHDLATWRDHLLDRGLSAATVRKDITLLSCVFTYAVKQRQWIDRNPTSLIAWPKPAAGRTRVVSNEEMSYLLASAGKSKAAWMRPTIVLLARSAMRRGELFSLRRCDVNLEARVAHLSMTKNGSARDVPLCPESVEALRQLLSLIPEAEDACLLPLNSAVYISVRFIATVKRARAMYLADCQAGGVEPEAAFCVDLPLHALRHTAATFWASSGQLGVHQLQAITGHKNLSMLNRYTHLSASQLAQKLQVIAQSR
ncbi:site-specific integrase [Pelomonas sp. V22]|uniref:tyrosine-type recombinase/integrase n=1 Tax=Pelomonas sp. V22 TaxID=2822139 RepID=UPI0024A8859B|nr:site-specific integrase [Pelomonas sp. V22]MDI4633486.1 site-specific integrase [Pelomonas sp. V22]